MLVNLQQYSGGIGAFYNRSSKYTIVRYICKFNNILMSLLLCIFLCLTFYVVVFIKGLKNCTGSILKISIIPLHLLICYSLLTQLFLSVSLGFEQRCITQFFQNSVFNCLQLLTNLFASLNLT